MEINKIRGYALFSLFFLCVFILCGCERKFWEYNCTWVSEEPYIYIYLPSDNHDAIIEIEGKRYEVVSSWSNDGTEINFYDCRMKEKSEETILWEAEIEVKNSRLYLTIVKDNISDYEGEVFILEQQ